MKPTFFANQHEFRKWLVGNHHAATELLVGFYKTNSGKPSMTWSQSVDQAICFGWIDGVRKFYDVTSYTIRFTPRKATSIWSAINIQKVENLTKLNLILPAGIAAFEKRKEEKSRVYSFEQKNITMPIEYEKLFKANNKAWEYFCKQSPTYRKTVTWRIISAKQEVTKLKRLETLIKASEEGKWIGEMKWEKKTL